MRIGLDIGGTKIEGVAIDAAGHTVASTRKPSRPGNEQVIEDLAQSVRELQAQAGSEYSQEASSLGIGIPGRVDSVSGTVWDAVNLHIRKVELGTELSRELGMPVGIENDVNAAALGAYADSKVPTMVFINLGTGLAAGIIRQGHIDHGASGAIGEIGHIPVELHRFACKCGQQGCLETVASGSALARLWPQANPPLPDIIRRSREGNLQAEQVLSMFAQGVATVIQIVALSIDPNTIVIGGGLTKTGPDLLNVVNTELERQAANSHFIDSLKLPERLSLVPAERAIGAIGAALAGAQQAKSGALPGK
ncbi:NagC family transcriptional regulator [Bombiscardovia apis]|uniref:NagC family transcriptional regulator n=1 Tax=Bombiscardovia apis TaxID=2932182 RepID=A0ABM8BAN1_9BIFI|nr:NagC family transcriptional regulator [Bombiscardovia apis]